MKTLHDDQQTLRVSCPGRERRARAIVNECADREVKPDAAAA